MSRTQRVALGALLLANGWMAYMQTPAVPFQITLGAMVIFFIVLVADRD